MKEKKTFPEKDERYSIYEMVNSHRNLAVFLTADQAKAEYKTFMNDKVVLTELATSDIRSDRIDVHYNKLIWGWFRQLWEVVKLSLILSHRSTPVESGFSTNEQILEQNMKEVSLVGQRIFYEGIANEGGVLKVDINRKLLYYTRGARAEYIHALKENKKLQTACEKHKQEPS